MGFGRFRFCTIGSYLSILGIEEADGLSGAAAEHDPLAIPHNDAIANGPLAHARPPTLRCADFMRRLKASRLTACSGQA